MLVVHPPSSVFSKRHAPSWLLFTLSAGCVNAVAFLACARFVTHITGTVSRLGIDASAVTLALDYSGLFGVFAGSVEGARDFAFLSVLSFAMGLQNAAVATSTGMLVRTTHMTGPQPISAYISPWRSIPKGALAERRLPTPRCAQEK